MPKSNAEKKNINKNALLKTKNVPSERKAYNVVAMSSIPANFDWVKVRSECSALVVFQNLQLETQADITARNEMLSETLGYKFKQTPNPNLNSFAVSLSGPVLPAKHRNFHYQVITFILEPNEIVIQNCESVMFRATLTINDYGECRLKIGDQEYTTWQVRKMALEKLFFEMI